MSKNLKEHLLILGMLFKKMDFLNLKINLSNCLLCKNKVVHFGADISENSINADPGNIEALISQKNSGSQKKPLFDLYNYDSKFISNFWENTAKLQELFKKCLSEKKLPKCI